MKSRPTSRRWPLLWVGALMIGSALNVWADGQRPSLAGVHPAPVPASRHSAGKVFRVGAHQVDISPSEFPVIVNAMFVERSADQVVDRLWAKALALDDGRTRVALCVVDTCLLPRDLIDRAKALAARTTGLPTDKMLVSATHTHSAPSAMACLGSRVDTNYAARLPPKIAEAIAGAVKHLQPARLGWAVVDDWEHTFNRRWVRRPDRLLTDPFGQRNVRANMHPGYESPDAVGPSGPVDPQLFVLAAQTLEGRPLALLANYSQHYYGSALLSSDYFDRFASNVAIRLDVTPPATPPFVAIMSQGTSGDLMWMDYGSPARDIGYEAYAREMADRAMEAYRQITWHDWVPLRMAERTLSLRYRVPDPPRLAWAREKVAELGGRLPQNHPEIYAWEAIYLHERQKTRLKLQALRVGDVGFTAIPNEVYALTGLKLKAQSPLRPTVNLSLANGAEGYIPPPEQHVLGGYTTWPARTAGLEVQAEPRIVKTLLSLLEGVAGQPRRKLGDEAGVYTEAVLAARPVAYWRLNEMTGPTARNAAGARLDAMFEDGVAFYLPGAGSGTGRLPAPQLTPSNFSGSQINRAAHFAGGRLRARVPLGHAYTVELWLWNGLPSDVRPVTGYVFSRGREGDPAARGEHLGIGGTHRPEESGRLLVFNGNERNQVLVGRTPLQLRAWHHVVLVREGRAVSVYLDGQLDATGELEHTVPPRESFVFLGGRCDHFANFEGKLDEVSIYRRALTAAEVQAHWAAGGVASPGRNSSFTMK